jgi:predicted kinase
VELVLLIGIQGAGKSTFYKERFVDSHIRLNLDMLRTRHRERILFEACLKAKQPVVIDNTNPTLRDRARYIQQAREARFRVTGYYFQSRLEDCLKRNEQRTNEAVIPFKGVLATFQRLESPTLSEGFDELYYVKIGESGEFLVSTFVETSQVREDPISDGT